MIGSLPISPGSRTLVDALLEDQRDLSAVDRFARWHETRSKSSPSSHRALIPLTAPRPGEQYAFEVDLDRCSGCKSCVTACHSLNGLDEGETWRSVGSLQGPGRDPFHQTITTACHHCVEPACLEGCPVLAYDKDPVTGIVRHLDDQCFGCQYCILMCPYEVPSYSSRRGIVRKCDMCHQRLAHSEAPACVQACPTEAIRITLVRPETVRAQYRGTGLSARAPRDLESGRATQPSNCVSPASAPPNPFLPSSPDPDITLPTTRYSSAKPLPHDLTASDTVQAKPQPAHLPLVWMLVLTQLGAGGFLFVPLSTRAVQLRLATVALCAVVMGLGGSLLHLGRPQKAWRAFLGLRRSWLSREITGFALFVAFALAGTLSLVSDRQSLLDSALLWISAGLGLASVLCSGMIYQATKRECWRAELSAGRFLATTVLLGAALSWHLGVLAGARSTALALMLALTTVAKLARELSLIRLCPDDADFNNEIPTNVLARSAFVARFRLGPLLRLRAACALLGGVALPLLSLVPGAASAPISAVAFWLCLTGESAERVLFFLSCVVPKMPGSAIP